MADSTRYFQLTPNILLEYHYEYIGATTDAGDATDIIIDLKNKNKLITLDSDYDDRKYLFTRDAKGDNLSGHNYSNLVLSMNKNDSRFVQAVNDSGMYFDEYNSGNFTKVNPVKFENEDYCDVYYDKLTFHFTSGNIFGDYDSLIFQANVKNRDNSNISILSKIFKRTDDVELSTRPMLVNEKLYTTHVSVRIPSIDFIINSPYGKGMLKVMSPTYQKLQSNTPIEFNIFGVSATYKDSYFTYYKTEQINSIQIPYYDSYKKVSIDIEEATDGDYFNISANVSNGGQTVSSFSDYIRALDENPENYIVMHEIALIENHVLNDGSIRSDRTHTEFYLVNLSFTKEDTLLDENITYRPVCLYANKDVSFTIEDTLKILNTEDNTTIVKKASIDYITPSKYGKKMGKIFTDDSPININVYNKRTDEDVDYVKISNSTNGNTSNIENHQYNITALVEATNIGVSIQQVSTTNS